MFSLCIRYYKIVNKEHNKREYSSPRPLSLSKCANSAARAVSTGVAHGLFKPGTTKTGNSSVRIKLFACDQPKHR